MAGLIAAVATGAVAGFVVWKVATNQHEFVAQQFETQNTKIQTVGDELTRTAGDLKRLDGALKTTEATLREVKDQVALVGTRTGMAQINTLVEAANKTLAEIKQATAPGQARAALAPLGEKLDTANKALAPLGGQLESAQRALTALQARLDDKSGDKARDEALARIETAIAGVKDAIARQASSPALTQANAKLDEALKSLAAIGKTADALKGNGADTAGPDEATKSLAAIKETLDAIRNAADAQAARLAAASKSLAALDTSVKQGFADVTAKQSDVVKAMAKPAVAPPQPAKPAQDLVVLYVSMAGKAAAPSVPTTVPATTAAIGLTPPAPPPLEVRFERLGGVDDEGQTKVIVAKLRDIVKGHSGCTIAMSGHADTFGGDTRNYELSRRRVNEVADKLRAAFAGDNIKIDETQWGERRLNEWTPDGTALEANRRVDIAVSCEK